MYLDIARRSEIFTSRSTLSSPFDNTILLATSPTLYSQVTEYAVPRKS